MSALPLSGVAVIGTYYAVPCMFVEPGRCRLASFIPSSGWLPVLGPQHEDAEHLNFPHQHYHIDWRFVPERNFARSSSRWSSRSAMVLTSTSERLKLHGSPVLKRRKCLREMPTFPESPGPRWAALERAQFERCSKLKPGNICPHRGIDLTPFAMADGTAICPGHGLRWNLKTGDLMARHSGGAA